jgi:hypothetical protein
MTNRASITDIPNVRQQGTRLGNWLNRPQAKELMAIPDRERLIGKRDHVILVRPSRPPPNLREALQEDGWGP